MSSSVTIWGNRVYVPETGTLWARSGFEPAAPRHDPFSSFPNFRSRRDASRPDSRQLRSGPSTTNDIDPFPPGGAIPAMAAPPASPRPGSRSLSSARAAVREHGPRGASRGRRPARAGRLRASGGSSATGRRTPTLADPTEPRAVPRAASAQETAARLFPARGFAALSQPKAPSFRESVAKPTDSALNNPKGARIEKVHRTAAPEILQPGAGEP